MNLRHSVLHRLLVSILLLSPTLVLAQDITSNLVGYWKCNGTGSSVTDESGNGATGTLTDGASFGTGMAGLGQDCVFNGATNSPYDVVTMGTAASLNVTGQHLTISAWVNNAGANVGNDFQTILARNAGTSGWQYRLLLYYSRDRFLFQSNGGDSITSATFTAFTVGTWHHVAMVYDAATADNVTFYVDGSPVTGAATTTTITSEPTFVTYIGRSNAVDYPWNGALDELRVYSRSLTSSDITAAMNVRDPTVGPKHRMLILD
jgi:concanavalin A-like lectin/glucanase superfamily protein